jgi:Zn-dependent metalloprotease
MPCPICFIVPPDLLAKVAEEGTPEERREALDTLAASASIRARRSMAGQLIRNGAEQALLALAPAGSGEQLSVYDVEHGGRSALPGKLQRLSGGPDSSDPAVNEAFDGADATYRFYKDVFDRDSIDDAGMELISSVHFGVHFGNAFWDSFQMVYGDGGTELLAEGSLTRALEVIGHEITHGVTERTAGLQYHRQSGALNESFSDVFGSLVKQHKLQQTVEEADWLIGVGILQPNHGNALRSMSAPGTARPGDPQPDHMSNLVDLPDDNVPAHDNGGVHINSGIPNRAFFLAAQAIGGHAWEHAGQIWFKTLTERLEPTSQFADAADATVTVAGELFSGGPEQDAVRQAWQTVGVLD